MDTATLLLAADGSANLVSKVRFSGEGSPWTVAAVAGLAVAAVAILYANEPKFIGRRLRASLLLLRTASVAWVLLMLAQPTIERQRVAPPRLVILNDASASMDTRDVDGGELAGPSSTAGSVTRREAVARLLWQGVQPIAEVLRERFQVERVEFASSPQVVSAAQPSQRSGETGPPEAADDSRGQSASSATAHGETRLGEAVDFALRRLPGARPGAIVVLSDGVNTAGLSLAAAAERARTLGVPIYAVAVGSDRPRPDVSVSDVLVEEVVFPGDRLQIEAAVRATGFSGKPLNVVLRRLGEADPLAEAPLSIGTDGEAQIVRLALRPTEPGPLRLNISVEPQAGEENTANNQAEVTVNVRNQPIRTLLVDSTPRFEYRALKSLLERDPAIDLRVWLQDADPDYASVDEFALRQFPATETDLLELDVVLLGDADPKLLPSQTWDLLERFVSRHGGGLAMLGGQRFMPTEYADVFAMRTLSPVFINGDGDAVGGDAGASSQGIRVEPTRLGSQEPGLQLAETAAASAAVWNQLPPFVGPLPVFAAKPGAQVLAATTPGNGDSGGEAVPVIVRHYVGAGEVLFHATDETWRWRWRNDDRYFARYWGQAVRRLARGRLVRSVGSLTTDRPEYAVGDPIVVRARSGGRQASDQDVMIVELEGDSTPTRQVELTRRDVYAGMYQATLSDLPPDHYRARTVAAGSSAPLTAEFIVAAPPAEGAQLVVDSAGLAEAARMTGGKFYTVATAGRLVDDLPLAEPVAIERLPDEPLWNSSWLLAMLCITLGSEWLLRRRSGLL